MTVWARLRAAIGRLVGERPAEEPEPAQPLHWRPLAAVAEVACGETGFLRWTAASAAATCPGCLARARLMILQKGTNQR